MNRDYFTLIDSCNEAARLANAIAMNSNYKEAIKIATDPLIADCCKEAAYFIRTLQEVLTRQHSEADKCGTRQ